MARDLFAITLLGDFKLSLADWLQLLNQIELVAVAKKHGSHNNIHPKQHIDHVPSIPYSQTLKHTLQTHNKANMEPL